MSNTKIVKKVYSLRVDDVEILSVEVETIDGLPPIKLNKSWLKKLANGQLNKTLNNGNGSTVTAKGKRRHATPKVCRAA